MLIIKWYHFILLSLITASFEVWDLQKWCECGFHMNPDGFNASVNIESVCKHVNHVIRCTYSWQRPRPAVKRLIIKTCLHVCLCGFICAPVWTTETQQMERQPQVNTAFFRFGHCVQERFIWFSRSDVVVVRSVWCWFMFLCVCSIWSDVLLWFRWVSLIFMSVFSAQSCCRWTWQILLQGSDVVQLSRSRLQYFIHFVNSCAAQYFCGSVKHCIFQDSQMNIKFKRTAFIWNRNIFLYWHFWCILMHPWWIKVLISLKQWPQTFEPLCMYVLIITKTKTMKKTKHFVTFC